MHAMSSPVALFVYNRADNTRQTLRALLYNTLAPQTDLYVYSDGGRDEASWALVREVRAVLHEVEDEVRLTRALRSMTIVERSVNYYLERNIIEGIADVFTRHDTVIVLEDDIVTSPYFLEFMNDAFRLYKDEPKVMHVSGFTRIDRMTNDESRSARNEVSLSARRSARMNAPHSENEEFKLPASSEGNLHSSFFIRHSSFYFTPFMAGWGWGTWRDRWQQYFCHYQSRAEALEGLTTEDLDALEYGGLFPCLKHLDRQPIPWDICWGIAIQRAGGLCLYPARTLVRNIGLDAGTHFRSLDRQFSLFGKHLRLPLSRLIQRYEFDRPPYQHPIALTRQTPAKDPAVEAAMASALTDWGIRYTWLGRLLRRLLKKGR